MPSAVAEKPSVRFSSKGAVRLGLSVCLPLLIFAVMYLLFGLRYATNDDATIANIAAGAYGPDRIHLVYVNILFGVLLRPFYFLADGVNWYILFQLGLTLTSVSVLLFLALERFGTARGLCIFFGTFLPLAPQLFYSVQYVKTSAVCAAAGLLLVLLSWANPGRRTVLGAVLVWMACLLRWDMFCAAGGLSAALFLCRFFALDRRGMRRAACTMALLLLPAFGYQLVDVLAYRMDADWNAFVQYNAARTELSDFKALQAPEENPFADEGLSDTDFGMLMHWDYYDGDVFPAERVRALADKLPGLSFARACRRTLRTGFSMVYGELYRCPLALTLLAGFFLLRWNKKSLAFWGVGALLALELFYLTLRGRFPQYVEAALQLCAVPFFLAAMAGADWRKAPGTRACAAYCAALACCAVVSFASLFPESRYYRETRIQADASALYAMSEDQEHLYLAPSSFIDFAAGYDVWHPRPAGFFSNIVVYGGWLSHAPSREQALAAYGLTDAPLQSAVDNDRVYLVARADMEILARYASEHLGREVAIVSTGENEFAPYQLRTVPAPSA